MNTKVNALVLGYAGAITAAVIMLVLGILGNLDLYEGAVSMMDQWHMYFSLSAGGILAGMIESAVISFPIFYLLGTVYNRLLPKK